MSEFTKGKWTADDMGEYIFAHEFNMMICQMRGWAYLKAQGLSGDEIIDVQKANARLIAAAPDMYDELVYILGYLYEAQGIATNTQYKHKVSNDIKRIEALIARIDGNDVKGGE